MYLFHVVLACIFFTPRQSLIVTCIALAMYLGMRGGGDRRAHRAAIDRGRRRNVRRRAALDAIDDARRLGGLRMLDDLVPRFATGRSAAVPRCRTCRHQSPPAGRHGRAAARYMLQTTHQLKAPFAAIHANTQLLLGGLCGPLPDAASHVVSRSESAAKRWRGKSRPCCNWRICDPMRRYTPQIRSIELHEVVLDCIAALQPLAAKRGIRIIEDIAPATIHGVRDHLLMMIDNIILNAVAYSHDGGQVAVSCRPRSGGGAVVAVEDQGIGIPATKLPLIFDDYFRTADAVKHNKSSTGLGLAIGARLPWPARSTSAWRVPCNKARYLH